MKGDTACSDRIPLSKIRSRKSRYGEFGVLSTKVWSDLADLSTKAMIGRTEMGGIAGG